MSRLRNGGTIWGPDGQFYTVHKDIYRGEKLIPDYFRAGGGAPEPVAGEPIVEWFSEALKDINRNGSLSRYWYRYSATEGHTTLSSLSAGPTLRPI